MFLHDVVERAASHRPDASALVVDGRRYSFGELAADVAALSRSLQTISAVGETVAVLAPNCYAYVLAYYGVPRSGRVLLALNQRLHPREWLSQLQRSGASVLIGEPALLAQLASSDVPLPPGVRTVVPLGVEFEALLADGRSTTDAEFAPAQRPQAPAWLMYTSGTTGAPKGVLLTHRSLLAGVRHLALLRPLRETDVFLTAFPLCHVAGYQVILAHSRERPAVVMARFDAADFVSAARDQEVSTCSLAPTMLDLLLDHLDSDPASRELVRARLRSIGYGSAPMPALLIRRVTEVIGCELNQGYGMTELSGNVTTLGAAEHRAALAGEPHLLSSAGTPGPLVELAIMDASGALVAVGEAGEVVVRGEQVCGGYHDDPGATAEAFAYGWFHTGDLGVLDAAGRLAIVDRIKDVIVTGGENVASREVEDALRALAGVRDVAVIGLPDARWGERICAAVVAADPEHPPTREDLVAGCRARLAGFKTPRTITFVQDLPRTASGKVRKAELRRLLG